jgi:hypothetical protein
MTGISLSLLPNLPVRHLSRSRGWGDFYGWMYAVYLQLFLVPFLIKHHGVPAINLHKLMDIYGQHTMVHLLVIPSRHRQAPEKNLDSQYPKFYEPGRSCSYWVFDAEKPWLLGGLIPLVVDHLYAAMSISNLEYHTNRKRNNLC